MEMGMGWKIAMTAMMLFFVWRLWPVAKDWMANGPKGSTNDWVTAGLLLGGVILFVYVLVKSV